MKAFVRVVTKESDELIRATDLKRKLAKRIIISLCFRNSVQKSCHDLKNHSFDNQVSRLLAAGYQPQLLSVVASGILKKKQKGSGSEQQT